MLSPAGLGLGADGSPPDAVLERPVRSGMAFLATFETLATLDATRAVPERSLVAHPSPWSGQHSRRQKKTSRVKEEEEAVMFWAHLYLDILRSHHMEGYLAVAFLFEVKLRERGSQVGSWNIAKRKNAFEFAGAMCCTNLAKAGRRVCQKRKRGIPQTQTYPYKIRRSKEAPSTYLIVPGQ